MSWNRRTWTLFSTISLEIQGRNTYIHSNQRPLPINIRILKINQDATAALRAKAVRLVLLAHVVGFHLGLAAGLEDDVFAFGVGVDVACWM